MQQPKTPVVQIVYRIICKAFLNFTFKISFLFCGFVCTIKSSQYNVSFKKIIIILCYLLKYVNLMDTNKIPLKSALVAPYYYKLMLPEEY